MKKFSASLAILALALVLGLALVGCDNEVDNPLNGTWRDSDGNEIILNNGNFIMRENGENYLRGTYTDNGSSLTLTPTDYYLDATTAAMLGITAGWKDKSQMTTILSQIGVSDADINEGFAPLTVRYTLNNNTLTLTINGETGIFTRQ